MEKKAISHVIEIVTPAPPGSLHGNRMTAMRWAHFLEKSDFAVHLAESWSGNSIDLLIALHALRSHQSIKLFKKAFEKIRELTTYEQIRRSNNKRIKGIRIKSEKDINRIDSSNQRRNN